MAIQRKRYRIETMQSGDMPIIDNDESDVNPHHHQIMSELRAIRAQMASHNRTQVAEQEEAPSAQDSRQRSSFSEAIAPRSSSAKS